MEQSFVRPVGIFIQPNGSFIAQRGGILTPIKGAKIRCVADIEALPWTKDQIVDALLFRMCDEYVRCETTDWETKKKAMFAMIYHSFGYMGVIEDEDLHNILASNPYSEDGNGSMVQFWRLGDLSPDVDSSLFEH